MVAAAVRRSGVRAATQLHPSAGWGLPHRASQAELLPVLARQWCARSVGSGRRARGGADATAACMGVEDARVATAVMPLPGEGPHAHMRLSPVAYGFINLEQD